jgi:hypothetical protein
VVAEDGKAKQAATYADILVVLWRGQLATTQLRQTEMAIDWTRGWEVAGGNYGVTSLPVVISPVGRVK